MTTQLKLFICLTIFIIGGFTLNTIQLNKIHSNQNKITDSIQNQNESIATIEAAITPKKPEIISKKSYDIKRLNSVIEGSTNAPVTITLWTDFQCPYCAKSAPIVSELIKKYPKDLAIMIKHFPLPFHKEAKDATRYALAAKKQNAYLPMYTEIFKNYQKLKNNPDLPLELGKQLGLDIEKLKTDALSSEVIAQIDKEMEQLQSLGVSRIAVPKYFINGHEYNGNRSLNEFSKYIDLELKNNHNHNHKH